MKQTEWIVSDGGPLILMEKRLKHSWGGIVHCSVEAQSHADNDYERACQVNSLVYTIPLKTGAAVVFGDMPLSTTLWESKDGFLFAVRLRWTEPTTDIENMLSTADMSTFLPLDAGTDFTFETPDLVLFDAAAAGLEDDTSLSFLKSAGRYHISTYIFDPDHLTSMYLHKFVAEH